MKHMSDVVLIIVTVLCCMAPLSAVYGTGVPPPEEILEELRNAVEKSGISLDTEQRRYMPILDDAIMAGFPLAGLDGIPAADFKNGEIVEMLFVEANDSAGIYDCLFFWYAVWPCYRLA